MTRFSLVTPVENIELAREARVLAIIQHLLPTLPEWRQGEDVREQLARVEEEFEGARTAQQIYAGKIAIAQTERDGLKAVTFEPLHFAIIGASAVVGLLLLLVSIVIALVVGLGLAGAGVAMAVMKSSNAKAEIGNEISSNESGRDRQAAIAADLADQMAQLEAKVADRASGFPEVKLADVRFALEVVNVADRMVLVDTAGIVNDVTLKAVDVSELRADLSNISNKVQTLLSVPPLLTPDTTTVADDPINTLFGEEGALQDLVSDFMVNLGKLSDVVLHLPMIPATSLLVERLNAGAMKPSEISAVTLRLGSGTAERAAQFTAQVDNTRAGGARTLAEISKTFADLETVCGLYANARTSSINAIHQNVVDVLSRAAWCGRRFYCPRTIQSPQYIQDLLGVDIKRAFLLDYNELLDRLRSDPEIVKRLNGKPEVEHQLAEAYDAVRHFMSMTAFDESGERLETGANPRHIEEQFDEAAKLFSNRLQTAMTGTAYPVLNFSSEAQLFFEPESGEWSSTVSPHVYKSADAIKYGSVVKAYSDLMVPLWEHLWTEKADFRKSELFRTNDAMIRMTEKESEKLINIADQFRADMRPVRENIYLLESDLRSKYSEIKSFRDSMGELGLLSEHAKVAITDERLQHIVMGDSNGPSIDSCEMALNRIPQEQAETRGTVYDPIDLIREPSAISGYRNQGQSRLLPSRKMNTDE